MTYFSKTVKISSKGQITIPKEVRDRLKEDLVTIIADDQGVRLETQRNLAGALKAYAKPFKPEDWDEIRDQAWSAETERLIPHGRRRP